MLYQRAIANTFMLAALIGSSGCAPEATKPQDISFKVLYEEAHCPFNEKRLQALHSAQEVESLFGAAPALKTHIGLQQKSPLPPALRTVLSNADFTTQTWVLVAWGTQPNPGYRAIASASDAHYANGTLQLPLSMQAPPADGMYAQVMVTPCQLVGVELRQPIARIELR